jgi:hypothetical protein
LPIKVSKQEQQKKLPNSPSTSSAENAGTTTSLEMKKNFGLL